MNRPNPRWFTVERALLVALAAGALTSPATVSKDESLAPSTSEPKRPWRRAAVGWQIVSEESESAAQVDAAEGNRGACPAGMVDVRGQMKTEAEGSASIEELQNETCTAWIQREFPERCASFDAARWRARSSTLPAEPMHFCIDRFEYPNSKGQYPVIMVSWHEARALCAGEGKRLCTETEWSFACEGEEAMPYPYGYERDPSACVVDRPWLPYHDGALRERASDAAMRELDALWQGLASGASPRCRSPFGVYDMTGNVDEWTVSRRPEGRASILKGGYWGPVRARCRASTAAHDEDYFFYQQGFRCCSSPREVESSDAAPGDAP